MTASARNHAQMQWFMADPIVTEETAPLLASAFSLDTDEITRTYALTRLTASAEGLRALEAITAAFSGDGNSYFARRMRAMRQRRDRKGQFAEEGGGMRALLRLADGSVHWVSGRSVATPADSNTFDIETPRGIIRVPAGSAEGIEAYLPGQEGPDGVSPTPAKITAADEPDIIDEADLQVVDSPYGWEPVNNFKGKPGEKAFTDGSYTVAQTTGEDGKNAYRLIDEDGTEIAQSDSWSKLLSDSLTDALGTTDRPELPEDMLLSGLDEIAGNDTAGSFRDVASDIAKYLRTGKAPKGETPEQLADRAAKIGEMLKSDKSLAPEKKSFETKFEGFQDDFERGAKAIRAKLEGSAIQQQRKEDQAKPVAKLPAEGGPVSVPAGMHEVDRGEYLPQGYDGQESPDFTDDPALLARKFRTPDLQAALREGIVDGSGEAALEFSDGEEYLPVEALYHALKKQQGGNVDAFVDSIYKGTDKGPAKATLPEDTGDEDLIDLPEVPDLPEEETDIVIPDETEDGTEEKKKPEATLDEDLADAFVKAIDTPEVSEVDPIEPIITYIDDEEDHDKSDDTEEKVPALIDSLSEEERQAWADNEFDHTPYLPANEEIELPDGYHQMDPAPIALDEIYTVEEDDELNQIGVPVGWTDDPYYMARDYKTNDLVDNLLFALEPRDEDSEYEAGYAPFSIENEDGEEQIMLVRAENIRDALQLQGEDTNEIIQNFADEAFASLADQGEIAPDVQDGQSSGDLSPKEIQAMLDGEGIPPEDKMTVPVDEEPSISKSIMDRLSEMEPGGGMTIDPIDGTEPDTGIVVAHPGHNKEFNYDDFMGPNGREYIDQYIEDNLDLLSQEGNYLGFWHDEDNNEMVLDVAEVFSDRDEAIQAGIDRNQQAIYDIGNNELIDTGGTGDKQAEQQENIPSEGPESQGDDTGTTPGVGVQPSLETGGKEDQRTVAGPPAWVEPKTSLGKEGVLVGDLNEGDLVDPEDWLDPADIPDGSSDWRLDSLEVSSTEEGVELNYTLVGKDADGNPISKTDSSMLDSTATKFTTYPERKPPAAAWEQPKKPTPTADKYIEDVLIQPGKDGSGKAYEGLVDVSPIEEDVVPTPPVAPAKMFRGDIPTKDLQPGDVTVGDNFTIVEVGAEPVTEFNGQPLDAPRLIVRGYFPGHAIQEKPWKPSTPISVVRGISPDMLPTSGDLPELHKPTFRGMRGGRNNKEYLLAYAKWRGALNAARDRWSGKPDVAKSEFDPKTDVHRVKLNAQDLRPGDISADPAKGHFIVTSVSDPDPNNPKHAKAIEEGRLIVTGYYPGHELQEKQWYPVQRYPMEFVRNGVVPDSGPLPAINQPSTTDEDGNYVRLRDPQLLREYKSKIAEASSGYVVPENAPLVDVANTDSNTMTVVPDTNATPDAPLSKPDAPYSPSDPFAQGSFADMVRNAGSWSALKEALKGKTIVFFDYETTGFGENGEKNNPVQLGAVKVVDGVVVDRFNVHMNPEAPLTDWSAENLKDADGNPISDEWLASQMSMTDAHQQFADWAGPDAILGAHNTAFDRPVLDRVLTNTGVEMSPAGYIDTLTMAREIHKDDPNAPKNSKGRNDNTLKGLETHYDLGLGEGWHTADADSAATANLFSKLIDHAEENNFGNKLFNVDENQLAFERASDRYIQQYAQYINELSAYQAQQLVLKAMAGEEVNIDDAVKAIQDAKPEVNPSEVNVPSTGDVAQAPERDSRLATTEWAADDANTREIPKGDIRFREIQPGDFMTSLSGNLYQVLDTNDDPDFVESVGGRPGQSSVYRVSLETGEGHWFSQFAGSKQISGVRRPINPQSLAFGEDSGDSSLDRTVPKDSISKDAKVVIEHTVGKGDILNPRGEILNPEREILVDNTPKVGPFKVQPGAYLDRRTILTGDENSPRYESAYVWVNPDGTVAEYDPKNPEQGSDKTLGRIFGQKDNTSEFNAETTVTKNDDGSLTASTEVFDADGDTVAIEEKNVSSMKEAEDFGDTTLEQIRNDIAELTQQFQDEAAKDIPTNESVPEVLQDVRNQTVLDTKTAHDQNGNLHEATVSQIPNRQGGGFEVGLFKDNGNGDWSEVPNPDNFAHYETIGEAKNAARKLLDSIKPVQKKPAPKPAKSKKDQMAAERAKIQPGAYLDRRTIGVGDEKSFGYESAYIWVNPDGTLVPFNLNDPEQGKDTTLGRVFGEENTRVIDTPEALDAAMDEAPDIYVDQQRYLEPTTPVNGDQVLSGATIIAPEKVVTPNGKEYAVSLRLMPRFDGAPENYQVVVVDPRRPNIRIQSSRAATLDEAKALHEKTMRGLANGTTRIDSDPTASRDVSDVTSGDFSPYVTDDVLLPNMPPQRLVIIGGKEFRKWQAENNIYADGINQARLGDVVVHSSDDMNRKGEGMIVGFEVIRNSGDVPREAYAYVKHADGTYSLWAARELFLNGRTEGFEDRGDYVPPAEVAPRPNPDPTRGRIYELTNRYVVQKNRNGIQVVPYVSIRENSKIADTRRSYQAWLRKIEEINAYRTERGLPTISVDDIKIAAPGLRNKRGTGVTWARMMNGERDGQPTNIVNPNAVPTPTPASAPEAPITNPGGMLGKITRDGLISLDSISVSARSDAVFFDDERYGNSAGIKWDETAQGYRVDAANRSGSGLLGTYNSLEEAVAEAQNFLKNSRGDNNGGGNGGTPTPTPNTPPSAPSNEATDFVDAFNNDGQNFDAELSAYEEDGVVRIVDNQNVQNLARIEWSPERQQYSVQTFIDNRQVGQTGYFDSIDEARVPVRTVLLGARNDELPSPTESTPEPTPIEPPSELDGLPSPEGTLAQRFINKAKERLFAVNEQRGTGQVAGVTDNNFDGVDPDGVPLSYKDLIAKGWRPKKAAQIEHAAKNRKSAQEIMRLLKLGSDQNLTREERIAAQQLAKEELGKVFGVGNQFGNNSLEVHAAEVGPNSISVTLNVLNQSGGKVGYVKRTLNFNPDGTLHDIYNAYLRMDNSKSSGFAAAHNAYMENWYIANGAEYIKVQAHSTGGEYIGGYVWALNGYNWSTSDGGIGGVRRAVNKAKRSTDKNAVKDAEKLEKKVFKLYGVSNWNDLQDIVRSENGVLRVGYPTPLDVAYIGWTPSKMLSGKTWWGQKHLKSSDGGWYGTKNLQPEAEERIQAYGYQDFKIARGMVERGENAVTPSSWAKKLFESVDTYRSDEGKVLAPYADEYSEVFKGRGPKSVSLLSPPAKEALTKYIANVLSSGSHLDPANTARARSNNKATTQELIDIADALNKDRLAYQTSPTKLSTRGKDLAAVPTSVISDISGKNVPLIVNGKDTGFLVTKLQHYSLSSDLNSDEPTVGDPVSGASASWKVVDKATGETFFVKNVEDYKAMSSEVAMSALGRALEIQGIPVVESSAVDPEFVVASEAGTHGRLSQIDLGELDPVYFSGSGVTSQVVADSNYLVRAGESATFTNWDVADENNAASVMSQIGIINLALLDIASGNEDRNGGNIMMSRNPALEGESQDVPAESWNPIPIDHTESLVRYPSGLQSVEEYIQDDRGWSMKWATALYARVGPVTFKMMMDKRANIALENLRKQYGPYMDENSYEQFAARLQEVLDLSVADYSKLMKKRASDSRVFRV